MGDRYKPLPDLPRSAKCESCGSVVPIDSSRLCGGCAAVLCMRCVHYGCRLCHWRYTPPGYSHEDGRPPG